MSAATSTDAPTRNQQAILSRCAGLQLRSIDFVEESDESANKQQQAAQQQQQQQQQQPPQLMSESYLEREVEQQQHHGEQAPHQLLAESYIHQQQLREVEEEPSPANRRHVPAATAGGSSPDLPARWTHNMYEFNVLAEVEHTIFGRDGRSQLIDVDTQVGLNYVKRAMRFVNFLDPEFPVYSQQVQGLVELFLGQLSYDPTLKVYAIALMACKLGCPVFLPHPSTLGARPTATAKIWVPNAHFAQLWVAHSQKLVCCDRPGYFFVTLNREGEDQMLEYAADGQGGLPHYPSVKGVPMFPATIKYARRPAPRREDHRQQRRRSSVSENWNRMTQGRKVSTCA